jgi:hypothetical protein
MAVLIMSNSRKREIRSGVKSLAFGMRVSGKSGKIRRRTLPTTKTAYPICMIWAAINPGVRYKTQGRRLSVGVSRTRTDSKGLKNGNRYGVVIELESSVNGGLRNRWFYSPVRDYIDGKRYEHHEDGVEQGSDNSGVRRVVGPVS